MKRLGATLLLALLTAACQTTQPVRDAPDLNTVAETFCRLSDVGDAPNGNIEYAYDPEADPAHTDTLETVEQIISLNETRNLLCKDF